MFHTGCEQRSCVNPDHLTLGTYDEVIALRGQRGNHLIGDRFGLRLHPERVPHGELHYAAKLTVEQIEEIRRVYASSGVTYQMLAERYDVTSGTIWHIVQGRHWCPLE